MGPWTNGFQPWAGRPTFRVARFLLTTDGWTEPGDLDEPEDDRDLNGI